MTATLALSCTAVLLALAPLAIIIGRSSSATPVVYGLCLVASVVAFGAAVVHLLGASVQVRVTLPLGLPWLGAHFRIDELSAFFLAVVNLGAFAASLFALGYGRHEDAPSRVLPFYQIGRASCRERV